MKTITWIAVAAVVLAAAFFSIQSLTGDTPEAADSAGPGSGGGRPGGGRPPPQVVASEVGESLINNRLKAIGNGTAQSSVSIVPLSAGLLTEVLVSSGQQVDAQTVLARLDDEEQLIARDRAASTSSEADADATRLAQLFRSNTTTQVELNRARASANDAKLALRNAELTLTRRTITAPIAGIVGFVAVDSGNYITAQTALMTIDNRAKLVVEFWVPERFANQIRLEQTVKAVALSNPSREYQGTISGIGSRIESDSRTLPVKAIIDNADDSLRPGMSFELLLSFKGQNYPAVNPLAIQWDSNGSFVWQIVDNKAQRVPAQIIQRNPESVLVDAQLQSGDQVVSEGLLAMRPGISVRIEGAAESVPQGSQPQPADPAAVQGSAASTSSTGS